MRSCVQIATRSFLLVVIAGMNRHAMNDAPQRISASTVTMRRFGPSGSWNKKNNALEHASAVITKRSKDVRFDSNAILFIIEYFSESVRLAVAPKAVASLSTVGNESGLLPAQCGLTDPPMSNCLPKTI